MKHATSDEERFNILYTLLEGEPEKTYNRHLAIENKTEALKKLWRSLEDNFGYLDRSPLI